jgi:AcrR family transcriptional regulator
VADVAECAAVSQRTIYEHFVGKRELLHAVLDSSGAQFCAAVLPAIRRSPGWPYSVRAGFGATCTYFAAEPEFAILRSVEVYAAGPEALALRDVSGAEVFAAMLVGSDAPDPGPLVFEAILGAVHAVLQDTVRRRGPEELPDVAPLLTYVALAPLLGAKRACEVANRDGWRRRA